MDMKKTANLTARKRVRCMFLKTNKSGVIVLNNHINCSTLTGKKPTASNKNIKL